jgi:hypothetical protein
MLTALSLTGRNRPGNSNLFKSVQSVSAQFARENNPFGAFLRDRGSANGNLAMAKQGWFPPKNCWQAAGDSVSYSFTDLVF